eukprot:TRINITY_DN5353_c0_g1_i2.p1 TRINITY_DN5353_c0_g1~~TRINITY_DN5353_c0_g1_i2.p1  ORF type:complete len:484 (+),score=85.42 TRINITY_DN5353_c0_g1_i2:111-1562(+)
MNAGRNTELFDDFDFMVDSTSEDEASFVVRKNSVKKGDLLFEEDSKTLHSGSAEKIIENLLTTDEFDSVIDGLLTLDFWTNKTDFLNGIVSRADFDDPDLLYRIVEIMRWWLIVSNPHQGETEEMYLDFLRELSVNPDGMDLYKMAHLHTVGIYPNYIRKLAVSYLCPSIFDSSFKKVKIRIKKEYHGNSIYKWLIREKKIDAEYAEIVCNEFLRQKYISVRNSSKTEFSRRRNYEFNLTKDDVRYEGFYHRLPLLKYIPSNKSVMHYSSKEMAKQMTFTEFSLFKKIRSHELVNWILKKEKDRPYCSPHLHLLVAYFNKITSWVITEIVSTPNLKMRKSMIKKFISLARSLFELKNYSGVIQIITGLDSFPVLRLQKSWDIGKKYKEAFEHLRSLVSPLNNWSVYRELIEDEPPFIPYIGLFLSDLTLVSKGNRAISEDEKTVEWFKVRRLAMTLKRITKIQSYVYDIVPKPELQVTIKKTH